MSKKKKQEMQKRWGVHLKELREERQIKKKELARKMEKEVQQISRAENGRINPTLFTILEYAAALNITPDKVIKFDYSGLFPEWSDVKE